MITTDYVKQPNVVGKFVYPSLTNSEAKTFAFLLQQTLGWNRESAAISTSFFIGGTKDQMGTGLSEYGQRKAVKALLKRGWITIVGHQDMRMAGHSVKVPIYEIAWAAILADYQRWMEVAATVVAPPAATVVAPAIGAATVVAPVPQPELPPSRNCSCPLIEHAPIDHKKQNILGGVEEAQPVDDSFNPFAEPIDSDHDIGQTKGKDIAPCRALAGSDAENEVCTDPWTNEVIDLELERDQYNNSLPADEIEKLSANEDDDLVLIDPQAQGEGNIPGSDEEEVNPNGQATPPPTSAAPPSPVKVTLAGIAYLIYADGRREKMAIDAAPSPASASEQVSEGVGACGLPRTLLRLLPADYQHVSAI